MKLKNHSKQFNFFYYLLLTFVVTGLFHLVTGFFSSDWPTVFNIYWLMTFILNSLTFAYAARKLNIKHVLSVIALIGICILSATLDSIPTIVKNIKEGGNSSGFQRTFAESENYGLKLIQLYLPAPSHRHPNFALKALQYNTIAPIVTENNTTSLGIIGAIGGFGAVFAFFISPSIRGYNRISIFGFSLLCIGYLLTNLRKKNPIKVQISFSVDDIPVADKTALINFRGSMYTVKMDSNPWTFTKELELPDGISKFLISFPNYLSITMRDFKISKIN